MGKAMFLSTTQLRTGKKKIGVSLKKEGKVKTGSKRKDRKADSSEI